MKKDSKFWLQRDPPLPPKETLPTMYDLPSDNPQEAGLPDEFHRLQPDFLTWTFQCGDFPPHQVFTGTDMNLYYDVRHPLWYKRPDWFLVVGVSRLYEETDLRNNYVIWQEGVTPFVIVELLSYGTAKEDLGEYATTHPETVELDQRLETAAFPSLSQDSNGDLAAKAAPLSKWEVYERVLRVPYYVVFSRYTNHVWFFKLEGGRYRQQPVDPEWPRLWIPELNVGLGLWQGDYAGVNRLWLRWYDADGHWIPTPEEQLAQEQLAKAAAIQQAEQERLAKEAALQQTEQERLAKEAALQQTEQERLAKEAALQRAAALEAQLKAMGIDPEKL